MDRNVANANGNTHEKLAQHADRSGDSDRYRSDQTKNKNRPTRKFGSSYTRTYFGVGLSILPAVMRQVVA